jgi:hypothetical protein
MDYRWGANLMKSARMLLALSGISDENNRPDCALTAFGTCAVLAADGFLGDVIDRIGENEIAIWFDKNGVKPPASDGLWVIQCVEEKKASLLQESSVSLKKWRLPMRCEVDALLHCQLALSEQRVRKPVAKNARWIIGGFQGLPRNTSRKNG